MKNFFRKGIHFLILSILLIPTYSAAHAQSLGQQVRGTVNEALSGQFLPQVSLRLIKGSEQFQATTNEQGAFRFQDVPIGRFTLEVSKEGYADYRLPDILVHAGKELILNVSLSLVSYDADEVEISSYNSRKYQLSSISTRVFTVEESQRFAATSYDPARLVAYYPGIAITSDQSNSLVIRGNSPNGVLWRVEGVDVVNPNHLTNAGTFTDRLTQSGGGPIILSNQLLADSKIQTSAFDPQYGNALAGVFDMRLRTGNDEKHEFVIQPSLIGLDLAAEGPFSKKSKSSFLVNYRYSTVGLFELMGLEITPESITYQDFSFNLSFPTEKAGTFTVFGMGGLSSNLFEAPREDSLIEENRDRFDVDFYSNMGAVGMTHSLSLNEKSIWRSVWAISAIESEREENFVRTFQTIAPSTYDFIKQQKLSFSSTLSHRINPQLSIEEGIFLTRVGYEMNSQQYALETPAAPPTQLARANGNSFLVQPYVSAAFSPKPNLTLRLGFHGLYFGLNGSTSLEPRANIDYQLSKRSRLTAAYGLHSQMQLYGTYFAEFENRFPNKNLGFTKAHHGVLRFIHNLGEGLSMNIETYYQDMFQVPISQNPNSNFSALNLFEGYVVDSLVNSGSGRNYGLEISLDQELKKGLYYVISGSLYESKYTGADGIERDTRFNGNYLFNAAAGKEFERVSKKGKEKSFGINLSLTYQGGLRDNPIDVSASQLVQRTVFDTSNPFSYRFPDFFRADLRFIFTRNKAGYTRTFAIDLLNVSNRANVAFRKYDIVSEQVVSKTGLGLIPLMSYRIEF